MSYNELTRRHFDAPARVGSLAGPGCFRGSAGSPSQGTWVQFDVQVAPGSLIRAARFVAFGCPHVIAACSLIADRAEGRCAAPCLPESVGVLRERLGVPVEKLGRLLLVEDAWVAALRAAVRGCGIESPPPQPHI